MQQRKDEILAKKARLAELRRQKELRQREFTQRVSTPELAAPTPARGDDRKELDSLVSGLLGERSSSTRPPAIETTRPSSASSSSQPRGGSAEHAEPRAETPSVEKTSIATQTLSTIPVSIVYEFTPAPKIETPSYSVGIQTTEPWSHQRRDTSTDGVSDSDYDQLHGVIRTPKATKRLSRKQREREDELRQHLRQEIEEEFKTAKGSTPNGAGSQGAQSFPVRALNTEEKNAITSSEDFQEFIERSSKVIEKAFDQQYDILTDYALDGLDGLDEEEDEGYVSSRGKKGKGIKEIAQFYDERWSKKRTISDVNFSPKFPELLLASYTKNPSASQDPSGLLHIWNLHLHSRPEYTFHNTSDVLTANFSPFHPSLILGGSYSGQVLLWDTRSRSPLPVQKTPLTGASSGGHAHPIYSIEVVGTQNANNIISCSTDGIVCSWTVDMLSQPQEYLELTTPPPSKTEDLSPTCMAFPPSDPTSFLVGTEEGTLYSCHRYDRAGAKAGVDTRIRYRGHAAPVMSVDFHPARGPLDLSDLVLTTSLDWSVKVWKTRVPSSAAAAAAAATASSTSATSTFTTTLGAIPSSSSSSLVQDILPVLDISREDVVYSARWSPTRPSIFALVDGAGSLEIWDLNAETEVPVAKASPDAQKKVSG
ncbi:MAG: hypothetical protein Q9187_002014, partial [Circinaria calcarea]